MNVQRSVPFSLASIMQELNIDEPKGNDRSFLVIHSDDRIFVGGGCELTRQDKKLPAQNTTNTLGQNVSICTLAS